MDKPKLFDGGIAPDDRGFLSFVNTFNFEGVRRFYMVENHEQGFIRAWHGHRKEGKYVFVVSGTALVATVPVGLEDNPSVVAELNDVKKFVLSSRKPQILWIPPGYYNGFKTLEKDTKVIFFSTSTLEESKEDDIRRPYDQWDVWSVVPR